MLQNALIHREKNKGLFSSVFGELIQELSPGSPMITHVADLLGNLGRDEWEGLYQRSASTLALLHTNQSDVLRVHVYSSW